MNLQEQIRRILKEEVEVPEKVSMKDSLRQMIDDEGLTSATELFGGLNNLIKTVYNGDRKEFSKDTGTKLVWISADGLRMFIHEVLIDELELPEFDRRKGVKTLGKFRFGTKKRLDYAFNADLLPTVLDGQPYYKVAGTSGDSGFGYGWITIKNTLGKRHRAQIYNQIIDKFNLQPYM